MKKNVVIIGAGPAGLTAALELLKDSSIKPVILESLADVGGISRTIEYRGNRMDIGGHRFFSKSDWVMDWWKNLIPIAPGMDENGSSSVPDSDRFMLIRPRLSRIYFLRKFFNYPISLSFETMMNLGFFRLIKIGLSYIKAILFQRKPENNLEDFFYNRFGGELYRTFFRDYTEKVWGVPCRSISSAWGAQRIKGLSIIKALIHAAERIFARNELGVSQKATETSLIERFLYPKLGPGQMWQIAADEIRSRGGEIRLNERVVRVVLDNGQVVSVDTEGQDGKENSYKAEWVISSMALRDFVQAVQPKPPQAVRDVAEGLVYRDFITIGLLVKGMKPGLATSGPLNILPDTWIYIQEPDVKIGRLQIFNNWSPALVKNSNTVWMGLEYFCQENDALWLMDDESFSRLAISELEGIGLINSHDVLDYHIVRVPKAYPAYFGAYSRFGEIREWADAIPNLFLVGRNGMHRYNNQDHSMVTAKLAVDAILANSTDKKAIWDVNVEDDYHEEK